MEKKFCIREKARNLPRTQKKYTYVDHEVFWSNTNLSNSLADSFIHF